MEQMRLENDKHLEWDVESVNAASNWFPRYAFSFWHLIKGGLEMKSSKKTLLSVILLLCSQPESLLIHCLSSFRFFSIYCCSDAPVVDVQTYRAIFVG